MHLEDQTLLPPEVAGCPERAARPVHPQTDAELRGHTRCQGQKTEAKPGSRRLADRKWSRVLSVCPSVCLYTEGHQTRLPVIYLPLPFGETQPQLRCRGYSTAPPATVRLKVTWLPRNGPPCCCSGHTIRPKAWSTGVSFRLIYDHKGELSTKTRGSMESKLTE